MSRIALTPNASGTGTLTIAAPNTNTDRTLTLPNSTGTLATTADVAASSSMVLLGTMATTSGTTQTLSGLTLTSYRQVFGVVKNVSGTATVVLRLTNPAGPELSGSCAAGNEMYGFFTIDLASRVFMSNISNLGAGFFNGSSAASPLCGIQDGISFFSTSISIAVSGGNFDLGVITLYGVK